MFWQLLIFVAALSVLLISAKFFTDSAEKIGHWLKLPPFVVGIFIVGIGTSLPELVSGIISVSQGASEILPGNVMGSNISNILLVTGLAVAINRKPIQLPSTYIYVDLHFLVGSFVVFYMIAYDGLITFTEASTGILIFLVHSFYLIRGGTQEVSETTIATPRLRDKFPVVAFVLIVVTATGIYFGAEYTVSSLSEIALSFSVPKSIVALTALSLGTTLPELTVNITAIRQNKAEMAIGNVLGSCIFNTLMIPAVGSMFGQITVSPDLIGFSLPVMAVCGLLFYLLTHDRKISAWEGALFTLIYVVFLVKIIVA